MNTLLVVIIVISIVLIIVLKTNIKKSPVSNKQGGIHEPKKDSDIPNDKDSPSIN